MPLYEYKCRSCGSVFEVMQKFSDEPLTAHEGCGGEVERLISPSAFQLKGTGWYITDYARKNGKHGSAPSSKEKPAGADKASTKTETKTETKSTSETSKSG